MVANPRLLTPCLISTCRAGARQGGRLIYSHSQVAARFGGRRKIHGQLNDVW
ncbi:hypothetical protein B0H10DRAFT_2054355 [Mycena sp. CBHHK59/15]|nr:hypothetical protein B0H10DRAFT_2054355 [Mycena sp. CBHHK59/15]